MAQARSGNSSGRHRIILVDDHAIVTEGLAQILNGQPDLHVCGCCQSAKEALPAIARLSPDVMVIDIGLEGINGIDLIKQIKAFYSTLPIVILSMHDERVYAERALKAGALGYVMKQAPIDDIVNAIRRVLSGERYLSSRMQRCLIQMLGTSANPESALATLTDREIEVFALMGNGVAARRIATQLNITTKTVNTYRVNIKHKLGLRNASELIRAAIEFGRKHVH